jgi:hypothetical protein
VIACNERILRFTLTELSYLSNSKAISNISCIDPPSKSPCYSVGSTNGWVGGKANSCSTKSSSLTGSVTSSLKSTPSGGSPQASRGPSRDPSRDGPAGEVGEQGARVCNYTIPRDCGYDSGAAKKLSTIASPLTLLLGSKSVGAIPLLTEGRHSPMGQENYTPVGNCGSEENIKDGSAASIGFSDRPQNIAESVTAMIPVNQARGNDGDEAGGGTIEFAAYDCDGNGCEEYKESVHIADYATAASSHDYLPSPILLNPSHSPSPSPGSTETNDTGSTYSPVIEADGASADKVADDIGTDICHSGGVRDSGSSPFAPLSSIWVSSADSSELINKEIVGSMNGKHIKYIDSNRTSCYYLSEAGDVYVQTNFKAMFPSQNVPTTKTGGPSSVEEPSSTTYEPRLLNTLLLERALYGDKILALSCGIDHTLAVSDRGLLYSWGQGRDGRLGHGDIINVETPLLCMMLLEQCVKVVAVSAGINHSMALDDNGSVFTWGAGNMGQLGHGTTMARCLPRKVEALDNVSIKSIAAGWNFSVVLSTNGSVYCFGDGSNGACGRVPATIQLLPKIVQPFSGGSRERSIIAISAGYYHVLALTKVHDVYAWGSNLNGQLGVKLTEGVSPLPVRIPLEGRQYKTGDKVVQISTGPICSEVITKRGSLISWGGEKRTPAETGMQTKNIKGHSKITFRALHSCHYGSILLSNPSSVTSDYIHRDVYSSPFRNQAPSGGLTTDTRLLNHQLRKRMSYIGICVSDKAITSSIQALASESNFYSRAIGRGGADEDALADRGQRVGGGRTQLVKAASNVEPKIVRLADTQRSASIPSMFGPFSLSLYPSVFGRGDKAKKVPPAKPHSLNVKRAKEAKSELMKLSYWTTTILPRWDRKGRSSKSTRTAWFSGIPPSLRGELWPVAVGNGLHIVPEIFEIQIEKVRTARLNQVDRSNISSNTSRESSIDLVDGDVPRTFADLAVFTSEGPFYRQLHEVLQAFVYFRPELGYVQGMSYLAGMICLFLPDTYSAFHCFSNLVVSHHLFDFFHFNTEAMESYYDAFTEMMIVEVPEVNTALRRIHVEDKLYLFTWFQPVFLKCLPLTIACRVWDNFLLEGTSFLFRTGIAILKLLSPILCRKEGCPYEEALQLLLAKDTYRCYWEELVTEEALFRTIFSTKVPHRVAAKLLKGLKHQ